MPLNYVVMVEIYAKFSENPMVYITTHLNYLITITIVTITFTKKNTVKRQ